MEETEVRPKPMVEIGGRPILWHIMMHYAHYGFDQFVIALGYKGDVIKKYMVDYCSLNRNLTVKLRTGEVQLNGAAARLGAVGDHVIVISYAEYEDEELDGFEPTIVFVDEKNRMNQAVEGGKGYEL